MIRVLLLTMLGFCSQAFPAEVDDALARAEELHDEGRYADSLGALEPFTANPTGDVAYMIARAHFSQAVIGKQPDTVDKAGLAKAIEWAERARALGNHAGGNLLYMIHGNGYGGTPDMPKAIAILKDAAEKGDPGARINYGIMAYSGTPEVLRDRGLAAKYFLELSRREKPVYIAVYYLGLLTYAGEGGQKKDEQAGMAMILDAANHGVSLAQQDTGRDFEYGWTRKPDLAQAIGWYEKAAEQGEAWSLWRIGMSYVKGEGRDADSAKAVEYFRRAVEQGSSEGLSSLAVMYATGDGVKQDFQEARRYYEQAADAGNYHALLNLAGMYLRGEGVEVDEVQAYVLTAIAERHGHEQAPQLRKSLEKQLSKEQLGEARRRLAEQGN